MLTHKLPSENGIPICGTYRLCNPEMRYSNIGDPYLVMDLMDVTGTVRAYGWPERYVGPDEVDHMSIARVTGVTRWLNGQRLIDLHSLEPDVDNTDPIKLIPAGLNPVDGIMERLLLLIATLTFPPLFRFIESILRDNGVLLPFLTAQGSLSHHHSYPGGLLAHSLECAEFIGGLRDIFPTDIMQLGVVAALFHDIGKIRTHDNQASGQRTAFILNHDSLTLELLSGPLAALDKEWPDASLALRYLWTWQNNRSKCSSPLMTIAEAISAADKISSGRDAEQRAFRSSSRQYVTFQTRRYWRPVSNPT